MCDLIGVNVGDYVWEFMWNCVERVCKVGSEFDFKLVFIYVVKWMKFKGIVVILIVLLYD